MRSPILFLVLMASITGCREDAAEPVDADGDGVFDAEDCNDRRATTDRARPGRVACPTAVAGEIRTTRPFQVVAMQTRPV